MVYTLQRFGDASLIIEIPGDYSGTVNLSSQFTVVRSNHRTKGNVLSTQFFTKFTSDVAVAPVIRMAEFLDSVIAASSIIRLPNQQNGSPQTESDLVLS